MTIDLEDFVDKEVIITLNDGGKYECVFEKNNSIDSYPYYFKDTRWVKPSFTRKGIYDVSFPDGPMNIKSIQLKNQPKQMTKLSDKAFQNLTNALTSEVISFIERDDRYVEFMQEMIPDALSDLMGQLDEDLKCELSMAIMDNIMFRSVK